LSFPDLLVGLVGAGIQASRSPALHEREGAAQGLRYLYRLIDVERLHLPESALPRLLESAEWMGFTGLNVTHPFKQAVLPLLTELSPEARALGAVNTVILHDGARIGHNTDAPGFARSFARGLPDVRRDRVVQLGAGGAGAAVGHALLASGVGHVAVFDAAPDKAETLARALRARFGDERAVAGADLPAAMADADGLVHATPTGMAAHPGLPLDANLLRSALWVAEIVYFPLETELLRVARALGCRTLDGSGMAVFQAAEAFEIFTGRPADAERMLRHFAEMSRVHEARG